MLQVGIEGVNLFSRVPTGSLYLQHYLAGGQENNCIGGFMDKASPVLLGLGDKETSHGPQHHA